MQLSAINILRFPLHHTILVTERCVLIAELLPSSIVNIKVWLDAPPLVCDADSKYTSTYILRHIIYNNWVLYILVGDTSVHKSDPSVKHIIPKQKAKNIKLCSVPTI